MVKNDDESLNSYKEKFDQLRLALRERAQGAPNAKFDFILGSVEAGTGMLRLRDALISSSVDR